MRENPTKISPPKADFIIVFLNPDARPLYPGNFPMPATPGSAGCDLAACLGGGQIEIAPGQRAKIPTGIAIQAASAGYAGFIYSRSGLGAREGLVVAQGVGIIDPDYTGEIFVYLLNTSNQARMVCHGQRIAQLLIQPFALPLWREEAALASTSRGAGGFGHTGA